jgi:DNA-binding PadR family transcriptional regulator
MASPPEPEPKLPQTAWAVLGVLSFGRSLSGYDVKKWVDASLGYFYWAPAMSQVYTELSRLERVGYATSDVVAQDDLRNKRVYRITPEGRAAIERWVRDSPVGAPVLKHSVALRVWLGHLVDPPALHAVVAHHRDHSRQVAAAAAAAAANAELEPEWAYPAVVNRWAARYHEREAQLAEEMLAELDAMADPLPAAPPPPPPVSGGEAAPAAAGPSAR